MNNAKFCHKCGATRDDLPIGFTFSIVGTAVDDLDGKIMLTKWACFPHCENERPKTNSQRGREPVPPEMM